MEPIVHAVVADSHYFAQDPDPHCFVAKSWIRIRIRIKELRISNTAFYKKQIAYLKNYSRKYKKIAHLKIKLRRCDRDGAG
jgi:hypothetical protein